MRNIVVIAASLLCLAACASSPEQLARASAISIGHNTSPDRIVVSDVQRGMTDVSWTAQTGGRAYHCTADDMVRQPLCLSQ